MKVSQHNVSRRDFLKATACGVLGGIVSLSVPRVVPAAVSSKAPSRAALVKGDTRADNVFKALKLVEADIRRGLAKKKRVVIKPNMVGTNIQLCASHADCLEAILEFLKPLVKEEVIIAESPGGSPAAEGYENYGYYRLKKKYRVRFVDLDQEPFTIGYVIDPRFYPRAVRFSRLLLDPDTYVISSAVMKTHDRAVVTLSLKNIVVGAAIKDQGFRWGRGGRGSTNDKPLIHGGPSNEGINYNLFMLARKLHPDLAVIDGFQGMEGNGPMGGTPVDHGVAVASTDWLAADRIGVELMGFDFQKVGYLWFSAQGGLGEGDLSKIEVLGEKVGDHVRHYRPHASVERQYRWIEGPQVTWPNPIR
jgi:uncharacterized protein (DUF362 family)